MHHPNAKYHEFPELREISWVFLSFRRFIFQGVLDGTPKASGDTRAMVRRTSDMWDMGILESSLEGGESPRDVEIRAVNKLYDILLNHPQISTSKSIVLVLHGRMLRIVLASIFHRDLRQMNRFPHHNTTVNIIDAVISPSPSPLLSSPARDACSLDSKTIALVGSISVQNVDAPEKNGLSMADTAVASHTTSVTAEYSWASHDDRISWKGIVFDSFEHLSGDLLPL